MRPLLLALAGAAVLVLIKHATAAEPPRARAERVRGWQVTECYTHPANHDNYGCRTHGQPVESHLACKIAAQLTIGAADGSRIWCAWHDDLVEARR